MDSTTTNSTTTLFTGGFCHAIDGKSRLTVPSAWRVADEVEYFMMPSSSGECLKVMLRGELERLREKAMGLPGPARLATLRWLGSETRTCKLDKAGRLVIPEELCLNQRLSGEVKLVGAMDTFEIWNMSVWERSHPTTTAVAIHHLAEFGL